MKPVLNEEKDGDVVIVNVLWKYLNKIKMYAYTTRVCVYVSVCVCVCMCSWMWVSTCVYISVPIMCIYGCINHDINVLPLCCLNPVMI